jgi:SPP1 family predicted phage head-tail adaptor
MSAEFAGSLNERVLIERPVSSRNEMGLQEYGWEPVFSCRAQVKLEGVGAESEAMSLSSMPRLRVTIRRRAGVTLDQRVNWKGRLLMIRQLLDDPENKDRLTLRCEELRP